MARIALIAPEGLQTSDRRRIAPDALTWREGAPLMFLDRTTEGHQDAEHVGNLHNFRRQQVDGQTWIVADVDYRQDIDRAREAMQLADENRIAGVSADIGDVTAELEVVEVDDDGNPTEIVETILAGEIIGATQLPMPAFAGARITMADPVPLVAALVPRVHPDWFKGQDLGGPTPFTVTEDGRIYGHLATWGTCHTGISGGCVTPPAGTDYRWFHTGAVHVDGEQIPVGHITMGTGHAPLTLGSKATAAHYDDTGTCAADVVVGEDAHGIWVAGAARPGVDLDALRAASLSGDWRTIEGRLELVAALAVNVPGFPIPRTTARVASGEQYALVAAGVLEPEPAPSDLALVAQALEALAARIEQLHPTYNVTVTEPDPTDTPVKFAGLAAMLEQTTPAP